MASHALASCFVALFYVRHLRSARKQATSGFLERPSRRHLGPFTYYVSIVLAHSMLPFTRHATLSGIPLWEGSATSSALSLPIKRCIWPQQSLNLASQVEQAVFADQLLKSVCPTVFQVMSSSLYCSESTSDACSFDIPQAEVIRHSGSWIDESNSENPLNTRPRRIKIPANEQNEAPKISNSYQCIQDPSIMPNKDRCYRSKADPLPDSSVTREEQYGYFIDPEHSEITPEESSTTGRLPPRSCNPLKRKRSMQDIPIPKLRTSMSRTSTQVQCGTHAGEESQSFSGSKGLKPDSVITDDAPCEMKERKTVQ